MSKTSITLQRGNMKSHSKSTLVVRASTTKLPKQNLTADQSALDVVFNNQPTVLLNEKPIDFVREDDSIFVTLPKSIFSSGTPLIHVHLTPWNSTPNWANLHSREKDSLSLAAMGWLGNTWYTGPLASLTKSSRVKAWIQSGGPASLTIDSHQSEAIDFDEALKLEGTPSELMHRCLVAATKELLTNETQFSVANFTLSEALAATLCVQALPNQEIEIQNKKPFKDWPAPWKRLCQNSGISTSSEVSNGLSLNRVAQIIPTDRKRELLAKINSQSPLIPSGIDL